MRDISYGFIVTMGEERPGVIGVLLTVKNQSGLTLQSELRRAGDEASAKLIARQFLAKWSNTLFSEDSDRLRLLG